MGIKLVFLGFFGLCGGGLVSAGLYAFITVLGLVPRLAARTHTASQIHRYENWIVAGSLFGNLLGIHGMPCSPCYWGKQMLLAIGIEENGGIFTSQVLEQIIAGLSAGLMGTLFGIFVGCLVMSLAETLDALPTMSRRVHLAVGLPYIILSLAIGKLVGSLAYFVCQISQ